MKKLLDAFASLKVAVVLLVLLLLGLAAGTIVESARGTDVAGRAVYYSWWFLGLQGLFVLSLLASVATLYPWGARRVGYLTTHLSLVLVLVGACISYFFKEEGQIQLWQGQEGDEIANVDREGRVLSRARLPFSVKLDQFRIEYYPGTRQPAGFRSEVQIIDPGSQPLRAAIWMNHELEHRGWRLFQSSYVVREGRSATILSASRDPGQPVVFAGYGLLVLGMGIVLGTRIAQARKRAGHLEALRRETPGGTGKAALGILLALWAGSPAWAEDPALEALRRLPVQHDGRAMPLDTLAREAVWTVTGERRWRGEDPVATVMSWTFGAQAAVEAPIVELDSDDLAAAAGLPPGTTHAPFLRLVRSQRILELIERAHRAADEGRPRAAAEAAAEKLERRLRLLDRFLARDIIRPIPVAGDPGARWNLHAPMLTADELVGLSRGARLQGWPSAGEVEREIGYNRLRPTRLSWIVLAAALLLSLLAWSRGSKVLDGIALLGLLAGFAAMTWGIGTRWAIGDRIPAANMYESLLFLGWGIGLFAVVAFAALRNRLVVLNANAMAALTMALTDLLPIDGFVHPVPPVLAGTPWLAIHVPIIMVSYAVLALGVIVAHMQIGFTIFAAGRADLIQRMSEMLYWYIQVGSLLLIAGILTGSIWAASSWGRYWGWDPKEVWSLVAFLAYVAILHARWERMIGPFGVAAISIAAFQTILMTYLGVNFVLGIGLHSYGMGDSPVLLWMGVVLLAEVAFLGWGWLAIRRRGGAAEPVA